MSGKLVCVVNHDHVYNGGHGLNVEMENIARRSLSDRQLRVRRIYSITKISRREGAKPENRSRLRPATERLCFGLLIFTTRPSAVSIFQTYL